MARVLILEDDEGTTGAFSEFLTGRGHSVRAVHSGDEALRIASSFAPEIMLCSLLLEGDKGALEVTRSLSASLPGLRVVFISGIPAEAIKPDFSGITVHEVLAKPIGLEEVARAVEAARSDDDAR